jgi:hypothetical protein
MDSTTNVIEQVEHELGTKLLDWTRFLTFVRDEAQAVRATDLMKIGQMLREQTDYVYGVFAVLRLPREARGRA